MADRLESRFDADAVRRVVTVNKAGRLEMRFTDADQREHVVSLPVEAALALGRLICDLSEGTPFLKGEGSPGARRKDA
jgi:hypothetical protein